MKGWPLLPVMLIALVVLTGLTIGLAGDGYEDVLANLSLALCLLPIAGGLHRKGANMKDGKHNKDRP